MNAKNTINRYFAILCLFPLLNLFLSFSSAIVLMFTAKFIPTFYTLFAIPQFLLPVLSIIIFILLERGLLSRKTSFSGGKPVEPVDFFLLFGIFCGASFVLELISMATTLFFDAIGHPLPEMAYSLFIPTTPAETLIFIFLLAVLPAIVEEFIYRLGICGALSEYSAAGSVVISSLAFGLMHGSLQQLFYAVAAGLLFGYIYIKTKNPFITVLFHFINNLVSCILMLVSFCFGDEVYATVYILKTLFCVIVGITATVVYIIRNRRKTPKMSERTTASALVLTMFQTPFFYIFLGLEIIMMILNSI